MTRPQALCVRHRVLERWQGGVHANRERGRKWERETETPTQKYPAAVMRSHRNASCGRIKLDLARNEGRIRTLHLAVLIQNKRPERVRKYVLRPPRWGQALLGEVRLLPGLDSCWHVCQLYMCVGGLYTCRHVCQLYINRSYSRLVRSLSLGVLSLSENPKPQTLNPKP